MKTIPLSKGKVAIIDADDFEMLSKFKWCLSYWGYAVSRVRRTIPGQNRQKTIFMHRLVMQTPEDLETDHISGDRLDNRKSNLRNCRPEQNPINKAIQKNNHSGFKGVDFHQTTKKFRASIMFKGVRHHLGNFKTAAEAGAAYAKAAKKLHGEFSRFK